MCASLSYSHFPARDASHFTATLLLMPLSVVAAPAVQSPAPAKKQVASSTRKPAPAAVRKAGPQMAAAAPNPLAFLAVSVGAVGALGAVYTSGSEGESGPASTATTLASVSTPASASPEPAVQPNIFQTLQSSAAAKLDEMVAARALSAATAAWSAAASKEHESLMTFRLAREADLAWYQRYQMALADAQAVRVQLERSAKMQRDKAEAAKPGLVRKVLRKLAFWKKSA